MLLDRDFRFVAANAAYLEVTGARLSDLLGRPVLEVFPNDPANHDNDSARRVRASLTKVVRTAAPDVLALIPYRVPRNDAEAEAGESRYWSATHTPILDASGAVAFILQHTVDVTALQSPRQGSEPPQIAAGLFDRAQRVQEDNRALDAARRHLTEIFEQAPGFVSFLRGPDYVFEIANAAYGQLIGHRDIVGRKLKDALPELAGQGFFELLDQVRETGQSVVGRGSRVLLQRRPESGPDELFVDFIFQPILGEGGSVTGVLVQGHDITAQKRLEAELAGQVERERFLAQSIPQQVWTSLPDGTLDFVNRQVTEYFGTNEADVLGAGWQSKIHHDDIAECLSRWRRALDTGEDYEVEFRLRRADGSWRWHLGRARAFRDVDGAIVKWFGTNTDMDELTRARDELRARSEMDRHLIGIVSHDLRNPLNAIGIGASLLKRGPLDPQQDKIVDRMMASFERAGRLIRDFLDFTQARVSGSIPVRATRADLREIAEQVCEEVQPMYPDYRYRVECTGRQTGQWDPDRMAQLIGNLVSNAFQHSPPGGLVSVVSAGGDTRHVMSVHNAGAPIPDADRERLFRPFERGRDAGGSKDRSIGLGLYISESIVRAHGGTIEAASSRADGTTFTVTLPYATMGGSSNPP